MAILPKSLPAGSSPLAGMLAPALVCALALAGCDEAVSTANFKGESHNVAQTLSDFQKDATAGDEAKLCRNDLAATLTSSLKRAGGCEAILKDQLREVDGLNLTVETIAVKGTAAQARVKSIWSGRNRITTLSLVKEGGRWKISGAAGA